MASLYFKYGTMDAGKSANLLMTAYNYEKYGKRVLLLKPMLDTRNTNISSRIGLSSEAVCIDSKDNVFDIFKKENSLDVAISAVLVDEVQFFTVEQIRQLSKIVDSFNIPVMCFGLKNSYKNGEIFESVIELLYQADNIEEIKSMCTYHNCSKKATHHLMLVDGIVTRTGKTVAVGDVEKADISYKCVCRKHYYQFNDGDLIL